jgi:H+/Cl- antiporter ClcA
MTPANWAALAVSLMTLIVGFASLVRWLVKHYLYELKPNGGSSIKDKVNNLEQKVELLTELVKEALRK